jgi:hypothetical protein
MLACWPKLKWRKEPVEADMNAAWIAAISVGALIVSWTCQVLDRRSRSERRNALDVFCRNLRKWGTDPKHLPNEAIADILHSCLEKTAPAKFRTPPREALKSYRIGQLKRHAEVVHSLMIGEKYYSGTLPDSVLNKHNVRRL